MEDNCTLCEDERKPDSFWTLCPMFVAIYALVGVGGVLGGIGMLVALLGRAGADALRVLQVNVAVADLLVASVGLPLTLCRMVMDTWVLGQFGCYLVAVMQSWPVNAAMLTYVGQAAERYKRATRGTERVSTGAGVQVFGVWFVSGCASLAMLPYVRYVEETSADGERTWQYCFASQKQAGEYIRGLLAAFYILPLCLIVILDSRTWAALRQRATRRSTEVSGPRLGAWSSARTVAMPRPASTLRGVEQLQAVQDTDLRVHKYGCLMAAAFGVCWCPLNMLYALGSYDTEHELDVRIDITYLLFFWLGFLSTCINPLIYASWCLPQATRDRLRGYFRFSLHTDVLVVTPYPLINTVSPLSTQTPL